MEWRQKEVVGARSAEGARHYSRSDSEKQRHGYYDWIKGVKRESGIRRQHRESCHKGRCYERERDGILDPWRAGQAISNENPSESARRPERLVIRCDHFNSVARRYTKREW